LSTSKLLDKLGPGTVQEYHDMKDHNGYVFFRDERAQKGERKRATADGQSEKSPKGVTPDHFKNLPTVTTDLAHAPFSSFLLLFPLPLNIKI